MPQIKRIIEGSYVVQTALVANCFAKLHSDGVKVVAAGVAGEAVLGVSRYAYAAGENALVDQGAVLVKLGVGGISAQTPVMTDASGQAVAVANGGEVVGYALEAGVAGDIIHVLVLTLGNATGTLSSQSAAATAAAITATSGALTGQGTIQAGGTGAAAGAWDTANHRDAAITQLQACVADIAALKATVDLLIVNVTSRRSEIVTRDAVLLSAGVTH